jgi:hypothetical protein
MKSFEDEVVSRLRQGGVTEVDQATLAESVGEAVRAAVGDYLNRVRRKVAPDDIDRWSQRMQEHAARQAAPPPAPKRPATPRRKKAA